MSVVLAGRPSLVREKNSCEFLLSCTGSERKAGGRRPTKLTHRSCHWNRRGQVRFSSTYHPPRIRRAMIRLRQISGARVMLGALLLAVVSGTKGRRIARARRTVRREHHALLVNGLVARGKGDVEAAVLAEHGRAQHAAVVYPCDADLVGAVARVFLVRRFVVLCRGAGTQGYIY